MKDKVSKLQGDVEVLRDKVSGHSEILDRVVSVEINIAGVTEKTEGINKRIDIHEEDVKALRNIEIKTLREGQHKIWEAIHVHAGLLTGISGSVDKLISSTNIASQKTEANTNALKDMENKFELGLQVVKVFFKSMGVLIGIATSTMVFIATVMAKKYGWW